MRRATVLLLLCIAIGSGLIVAWLVFREGAAAENARIFDQHAHGEWFPLLRSGRVVAITDSEPQRNAGSRPSSSPALTSHFLVQTYGRLPAVSERLLAEHLKAGMERDESDARAAASRAVSARDRFAEGKLRCAAYLGRASLSLLERGDYVTVLSGASVPEPATHNVLSCGQYASADGTFVRAVFYVDKSDPVYARLLESTVVSREQMFEDTILELNRLDLPARQQRFADSITAAKELEDIRHTGRPMRDRGKAVEALKGRTLPDEIEFDPVRVEFRRSRW